MENTANIDYTIRYNNRVHTLNIQLSDIEEDGLANTLVKKNVIPHKLETYKVVKKKVFFSKESKEEYVATHGAFMSGPKKKYKVLLATMPEFEKFTTLPSEVIVDAVNPGQAMIAALKNNGINDFPKDWKQTKWELVPESNLSIA